MNGIQRWGAHPTGTPPRHCLSSSLALLPCEMSSDDWDSENDRWYNGSSLKKDSNKDPPSSSKEEDDDDDDKSDDEVGSEYEVNEWGAMAESKKESIAMATALALACAGDAVELEA